MKIKDNPKAVVIGGGIHGLTSAIALAKNDIDVTLLEKDQGLFQETSGSTHNRAHLGYHYPRSIETAIECLRGLEFFKERYPQALFYPQEAYYLIAKEGSKITTEEFKRFCEKIGIPYKDKFPQDEFILKDSVESSFSVPEPVFNTRLLVTLLEQEAIENKIRIMKGAEAIGAKEISKGTYQVTANENGRTTNYHTNIIINATYAYANNILKILGLEKEMVKYRLQTTEVVVAKNPIPLPALTVMDGRFLSVMSFAGFQHQNLFLVYDVVNSVVNEEEGYFFDDSKTYPSNWKKMVEHGSKYFPFMSELEYVASLWGSRPIPVDNRGDSRQTRLIAHISAPGIYSILEGKFISAPLIAQNLVHRIREDGFIQ